MAASKALYIDYGTTRIPYMLQYSKRKTLGITVSSDQKVTVTAPLNAAMQAIEKNLQKKAGWVYKQLRRVQSVFQPVAGKKRKFISGETVYYLGRKYRLKVKQAEEEAVLRRGRYLHVSVRQKRNTKKIEMLLYNWYRQQAKEVFKERMGKFSLLLKREKVQPEKLIVRAMQKRWGSCTPCNNFVLNTELVKAPMQCIDYVILHEWCHLKHFNHGKGFYALLDRYMPDWPKRKRRLETIFI